MRLTSKTQRVLTLPIFLPLTVIVAVGISWLISKVVKENRQ